MRDLHAIEKKPATRELINWIRALQADPDFDHKDLGRGNIPYLGVLFKKSPDFNQAVSQLRRFPESVTASTSPHIHREIGHLRVPASDAHPGAGE